MMLPMTSPHRRDARVGVGEIEGHAMKSDEGRADLIACSDARTQTELEGHSDHNIAQRFDPPRTLAKKKKNQIARSETRLRQSQKKAQQDQMKQATKKRTTGSQSFDIEQSLLQYPQCTELVQELEAAHLQTPQELLGKQGYTQPSLYKDDADGSFNDDSLGSTVSSRRTHPPSLNHTLARNAHESMRVRESSIQFQALSEPDTLSSRELEEAGRFLRGQCKVLKLQAELCTELGARVESLQRLRESQGQGVKNEKVDFERRDGTIRHAHQTQWLAREIRVLRVRLLVA